MNTLRLLLASIGVVLFQWAFLQGLPLSQYGNPYIYVWVLMLLPQPMSRQRQLLIAFLLGSIMDSFEQSGGAHSLACLALILVKPSLENALLGFRKPEEDEGLAALPLGAFLTPLEYWLFGTTWFSLSWRIMDFSIWIQCSFAPCYPPLSPCFCSSYFTP